MILAMSKKTKKKLSELEHQVVSLALRSGFTNQEVAEQLDVSYVSVVCAMHRAQRKVAARSHRQGYAMLVRLLNGKSRS